MSALRILLVSEDIPHPHLGGLGKHVVVLGNALMEAGHRVDIMGNNHWPLVVAEGDVAFRGRVTGDLNVKGAEWKEKKLGFYNYHRRAFLARRFARSILAVADRYDVVHYHGHVPILANYLPESINFVQTRHDQGGDCLTHVRFRGGEVCRSGDAPDCAGCLRARPNVVQRALSAGAVRRWRDAVTRACTRHKLIFVSEFLRANLERTLGPLRGDHIHVVHNFIDADVLEAALAGGVVLSARPDVFIACRVDQAKGVRALLDAAANDPRWQRHVTVAGDGPDLETVRRRAVNSRVSLLGWTPYQQVVCLTSVAGSAVVPSVVEESCGTTILEALALGRPVHALLRGGTPELVRYQRYAGQLRLRASVGELLEGLLADHGEACPGMQGVGRESDVRASLPAIERIYRQVR